MAFRPGSVEPICPLNCGDALDPHTEPQGAAELARNHGKAAPEDHANIVSPGRVELDPAALHARQAHRMNPALTVRAMPPSDRLIRAQISQLCVALPIGRRIRDPVELRWTAPGVADARRAGPGRVRRAPG